jgi:xylulose-5-phosphate/fructose-6-phosphate phosphoketolase
MELSALGIGNSECRAPINFDDYFTADKPVVFNFHGYPEVLKGMLFDQKNPQRFRVHGYIENGSTTTPFDMHVRNKTSRWHLAMEAVSLLREREVVGHRQAKQLIAAYKQKLDEHSDYIRKYGVDPPEIENWTWKRNISS